ncbi:MAG: hypothetical protein AAGL24_13200 [Pseudomonadota bacterium]
MISSSKAMVGFIAVVGVALVVVITWWTVNGLLGQDRFVQLRDAGASSGSKLDLDIEAVDPVRGVATGTIRLSVETRDWGVKADTREIEQTKVVFEDADTDGNTATGGAIVGESDPFTLTRRSPVSTRFTGEAPFSWRFRGRQSGVLFPLDGYRQPVADVTFVAHGFAATVRDVPLVDIRIADMALVTTTASQEMSANGDRAIEVRLVRPWPMQALFFAYLTIAGAFAVWYAFQGEIKTMVTTIIGLGTLFGARDILTRKTELYPTLVDYTLLILFVVVAYGALLRAVTEKKDPEAETSETTK